MAPTAKADGERFSGTPPAPRLEELIAIAVAIAAGCETCAQSLVRRALQQGTTGPLIKRTLGIVAHLRTLDCFAQAVGPEVVARMAEPLQAGERALRAAGGA
jgi:AhpD family alkylhydroperoxidase